MKGVLAAGLLGLASPFASALLALDSGRLQIVGTRTIVHRILRVPPGVHLPLTVAARAERNGPRISLALSDVPLGVLD